MDVLEHQGIGYDVYVKEVGKEAYNVMYFNTANVRSQQVQYGSMLESSSSLWSVWRQLPNISGMSEGQEVEGRQNYNMQCAVDAELLEDGKGG